MTKWGRGSKGACALALSGPNLFGLDCRPRRGLAVSCASLLASRCKTHQQLIVGVVGGSNPAALRLQTPSHSPLLSLACSNLSCAVFSAASMQTQAPLHLLTHQQVTSRCSRSAPTCLPLLRLCMCASSQQAQWPDSAKFCVDPLCRDLAVQSPLPFSACSLLAEGQLQAGQTQLPYISCSCEERTPLFCLQIHVLSF